MVRRPNSGESLPGDRLGPDDADGSITVDQPDTTPAVGPGGDSDNDGADVGDDEGDDEISDKTGDQTIAAAPSARRRSPIARPRSHPIHTMPTQSILHRSARSREGPQIESTHYSTATTPLEALRLEEIERTQMFLRLVFVILFTSVIAVSVADGNRIARSVMMMGVTVVGSASAWLYWAIRTPEGYTTRRVTVAAYFITLGAFAGVYYWGVFSPSSGLVVLGLYFFSYGASFRSTFFIYLTCAAVQAALATLILTGLIPDLGILNADHLDSLNRFILQAIVQFFYLFAFIIARKSRQATLDAVTHLEAAVRAVSHREALLLEARQDLDRALRVGGPGRYTGQLLDDFVLGNLIGHGGMGEVYDATHQGDQSPAAVKLLHARVLADSDHRQRFVRETRIAQALHSPHIVEVLKVGATDGDVPFLAMEKLHGSDLAEQLRRRRRLPPLEVITMVEQIAEGLAVAHDNGIVHRDIKPHNLFLADSGADPIWKILDFGVSKAADQSGTLTQGHIVGTPAYMAPEQARGEAVDLRADVYALAAITYRALTGQPPFRNKDLPTTLYDVVYRMPPCPSQVCELDAAFDWVLAIGLAKRREDRFESGRAFAHALGAANAGTLEPTLKARARALIDAQPWGHVRS